MDSSTTEQNEGDGLGGETGGTVFGTPNHDAVMLPGKRANDLTTNQLWDHVAL